MHTQEKAGDIPQWPHLKKDDKLVRGKNDRLFLDNDQNSVVLQHRGELLFSPLQLRSWRRLLESRIAWLERREIPYFFLVPPNAHSVYPEDLPDHISSAATRPVMQLMDHLQEEGSFARLIYPLQDLLDAKPELIYPKTDPHWSGLGAFIAYRRLGSEIGKELPMSVVEHSDVKFNRFRMTGELGFKTDPEQESEDIWARVERPEACLVSDNGIPNTGSIVITECHDAPDVTCLLLGDSFSGKLLPFLASSFRRLVFAHSPTLDHDFVREQSPDVVVSVLNERFLIAVPDDVGGPTVRELEHAKKQQGAKRPARTLWREAARAP